MGWEIYPQAFSDLLTSLDGLYPFTTDPTLPKNGGRQWNDKLVKRVKWDDPRPDPE